MSAVLRSPLDAAPSASVGPPRRRASDDEPAAAAPAGLAPRALPQELRARFAVDAPLSRVPEARPAATPRRRASDDDATRAGRVPPARAEPRVPAVDGLQRFVCISETGPTTTDIDVHVIASIAGLHHRRMDVTGVLVHGGGYLVQVVEGRAEALAAVMRRIEEDPHHRATRVLSNAAIGRRRFDRWATVAVRDESLLNDIGELHRSGQIGEHLMAAIVDRL
jgi:hypothetical protein